jgi:hypothetical protein
LSTRIVVSGGIRCCAISISSNPTTETSGFILCGVGMGLVFAPMTAIALLAAEAIREPARDRTDDETGQGVERSSGVRWSASPADAAR